MLSILVHKLNSAPHFGHEGRYLLLIFNNLTGGAGGYCPRVQKVTSYSSTSIVCLRYLQPGRSTKQTKVLCWLRDYMSLTYVTAHEGQVIGKYVTAKLSRPPKQRDGHRLGYNWRKSRCTEGASHLSKTSFCFCNNVCN